MKKVVRFDFSDGPAYFAGTRELRATLGDLERYSDDAMTWVDDIEDAVIYSSAEYAERDASLWREVFDCPIVVVEYPQE